MYRLLNILVNVFVILHVTNAFKPVIFMHGIFGNASEANQLFKWIKNEDQDTETFPIQMYNTLESGVNLVKQVDEIGKVMMNIMHEHPEGVNLICYSQGGLVCRGVLEQFAHNVDTFISISSPQAGQFGDTDYINFFVKNVHRLHFRKLEQETSVANLINLNDIDYMNYFLKSWIRDNVYRLAYTEYGQDVSIANYWNDPHHQDLYREKSKFLAVFNNDTFNPRSEEYKSNFMRLKKMVMIGGPDDGVITPWQSSHFGFYDEKLNVVEMKDQKWFTDDTFGLKTLYKRGDLVTCTFPGIHHTSWPHVKSVFDKCILPHLT